MSTPSLSLTDAISAVETDRSTLSNDAASVQTAQDASTQAHQKADTADGTLKVAQSTQSTDQATYVGDLKNLQAAAQAEIDAISTPPLPTA